MKKCNHQIRWEESKFYDGSPFECIWCFEAQEKSLYYEIHVTLEPDFDRMVLAKTFADKHDFHMGKLLLLKKEDETSHKDMFFTGRAITYWDAYQMTDKFIEELLNNGFKVIRYKIENTVLDSKIEDKLELLNDKTSI